MDGAKQKRDSTQQEQRVYEALNTFLTRYLVQRNEEGTLSMLSDQVYSVGAGEGEVAICKEAFRRLLQQERNAIPGSIPFRITDYVQAQRAPGYWECFCNVETTVALDNGKQVQRRMRLTAGIRQQGEDDWIESVHFSEPKMVPEEGEFFSRKFLTERTSPLSRESKHELMEILSQIMPGGVVGGYAEEGFPLYVANDRLLHMAGYDSYGQFEEDIWGQIIHSIHPDDRARVEQEMKKLRHVGDPYEIEYRMKRRDGSYFWVRDIGRRTVASDGRDAIISVLVDIDQQVRIKNDLEYEVIRDALTGIYNRKGAQGCIDKAMKRGGEYLFFMIDLDNFKRINDVYGHEQGDLVLCTFAQQLASAFRRSDTVFRMGGDEFAVMVTDSLDVPALQRKMEAMMSDYRQMMDSRWPAAHSTVSIGGVYGRRPRSFQELYRLADEVLYEVKRTGKGRLKLRILDEE